MTSSKQVLSIRKAAIAFVGWCLPVAGLTLAVLFRLQADDVTIMLAGLALMLVMIPPVLFYSLTDATDTDSFARRRPEDE